MGEYPDLEEGRLNDWRRDCDISMLEERRRRDDAGLRVGVRGGEDIVKSIIVVLKYGVGMFGASEPGKRGCGDDPG